MKSTSKRGAKKANSGIKNLVPIKKGEVRNPTGRPKLPEEVTFGDPNMDIKRDSPERRAAFRSRHGCDQAKDKTSPAYWSCKMWDKKPVSEITK